MACTRVKPVTDSFTDARRRSGQHCHKQLQRRGIKVYSHGGAAERRELGSSGIQISNCCLGTMTWGGEQNDEKDAHNQLSYAIDQGINFIDTAEVYPVPPTAKNGGNTDRCIATWLKGRQRDRIVLASKVAGFGNNWIRGDNKVSRVSPKQIQESVDSSLQRLGTEYIDLLQVHWPDRYVGLFGRDYYDPKHARWEDDISFEEQLQGLAAVVKAGKNILPSMVYLFGILHGCFAGQTDLSPMQVRQIGLSNETSYGVMRFLQAAKDLGLPRIVSIQNNYSMIVRVHFDVNLAETCHKNNENVALLAYSPLAGGVLSGKYMDGTATPYCRLNKFEGYMARYNNSPAREAVARYVQIAKDFNVKPVELALAWCKQRWTVTSTIIGATTMQQLQANVEAFDVELPEQAIQEIDRVFLAFKDPSTLPLDS